jgi:AraC-like DNA-binding protein
VRKLRLARAKQLLLDGGGLTLAEISARCGYGDYNYFISVFSRAVGCSPGAWRKNNL